MAQQHWSQELANLGLGHVAERGHGRLEPAAGVMAAGALGGIELRRAVHELACAGRRVDGGDPCPPAAFAPRLQGKLEPALGEPAADGLELGGAVVPGHT